VRLLADEHIPPAIISALRGDGHDVAVVGDDLESGVADTTLLVDARDTDRRILSEDTDFRGAGPELDVGSHPDVLACDTAAPIGEIAAAVRDIDPLCDDLDETTLFVPGIWV
jgi:predicted nuclease of predicted toxin-antitoxin system